VKGDEKRPAIGLALISQLWGPWPRWPWPCRIQIRESSVPLLLSQAPQIPKFGSTASRKNRLHTPQMSRELPICRRFACNSKIVANIGGLGANYPVEIGSAAGHCHFLCKLGPIGTNLKWDGDFGPNFDSFELRRCIGHINVLAATDGHRNREVLNRQNPERAPDLKLQPLTR
jgi:hypothetical protein